MADTVTFPRMQPRSKCLTCSSDGRRFRRTEASGETLRNVVPFLMSLNNDIYDASKKRVQGIIKRKALIQFDHQSNDKTTNTIQPATHNHTVTEKHRQTLRQSTATAPVGAPGEARVRSPPGPR